MQNFRPKSNHGGKRLSYIHRTRDAGKTVEIEVHHRDGGMNYFSGGTEKRGVEVVVTNVEISGNLRSFDLMGNNNVRILIAKAPRYSEKKVTAAAAALDGDVAEIARAWEDNPNEGLTLLRTALQQALAVAA